MSHGFESGMIWASVMLSGIPVAIFIAAGIALYRRFREERAAEAAARANQGRSP